MPAFHCVDDGKLSSNLIDASAGAPAIVRPPPRFCNWEYCAVIVADVGGLFTPPDKVLVYGRSKKSPDPPRKTRVCRPLTSYAMPNRGATAIVGQLNVPLGIPPSASTRPFSMSPVPGTTVPIASELLGPRFWPVFGLTATRLLPEH